MTHGYTNEAGEPIMSGEAYRYEQALDAANPPYCGMCGGAHDELNCPSDGDYEDEEDLDELDTCLNRVDGHWYVVTYGRAPYTIHAKNCPTCATQNKDDEDETEKTMEIPVVGYQCGVCDEAFPPGVTGHTNDNPCAG